MIVGPARAPGLLAAVALLLLAACTKTGYQVEGGKVTFVSWDEASGSVAKPISGADAATFAVLEHGAYGKDHAVAFYRGTRIDGADAGSFTALSANHARDRSRAYFQAQAIERADPATFALIDAKWARDGRDVFLQARAIGACDAATFALLRDEWQRDARCAYYRGHKLANAAPGTFQPLNAWYAKDAQGVYYRGSRMADADAASFGIDTPCELCGRDARGCYRSGEAQACR